MIKELGSLQQRRDFHKCVFMYKCMNGLAPQYLCDMFTSNSHSYNIRNASQPKPPTARTAYYQCNVSVSGLKLWNSLPQDIQNSQSVGSFKKSLHKYLSQTTILRILCFYSSVYFMYIKITFYLFILLFSYVQMQIYVMRHAKTRRFSLNFVRRRSLKCMVPVRIVKNRLTTESNNEIIQLSINPFI